MTNDEISPKRQRLKIQDLEKVQPPESAGGSGAARGFEAWETDCFAGWRWKSARGLAHSRTLARSQCCSEFAGDLRVNEHAGCL
jgi:hypothetical protein